MLGGKHTNHRRLLLCACFALALFALFDGLPLAIAIILAGLCSLQGYRFGAASIAGLLLGTLVALVAAPPLGRLIEPASTALTGLTGLLNRLATISVIGVAIIALCAFIAHLIFKSLASRKPALLRHDKFIGAALGALEGLILALGLAWVLLAVEPIARVRVAPPPPAASHAPSRYARRTETSDEPAATLVVELARVLRDSAFGAIARATSPFTTARALAVAQAFSEVSRDPHALRYFLDTPAYRSIYDLPSYHAAASLATGDIYLTRFFSGPGESGIDAATLGSLATNQTILKILDETTLVRDMAPLADSLEAAVFDARAQVGTYADAQSLDEEDDYSVSGVR